MLNAVKSWLAARRGRWALVVSMAAALLTVNFAVRFALRAVDSQGQDGLGAGAVTFGATAAVALGLALWRIRGRETPPVAGELFFAILIAAIVIACFGSSVSGGEFEGVWMSLGRVVLNVAVMYFGAGLGLFIGTALGADAKSKALRGYVRAQTARRGGRRR